MRAQEIREIRFSFLLVVVLRDGQGVEIARQVVGVGSLTPGEQRTVSLSVEVFKPGD